MIHTITLDKRGNRKPVIFASEAELDNWLNTQRRLRTGAVIGAGVSDGRPSVEVLERRAGQYKVTVKATTLGWGWRLPGEGSYHLCSSRGQTLRDAYDNGHLGD